MRMMRRKEFRFVFITVIAVALAMTALLSTAVNASAHYFDEQEAQKEEAHAVAEAAREAGFPENHPIITEAQGRWWSAQMDIDRQLDLLTRVVWFEAGSNWLSDRHQQLVAQVVLNRIADPRFPNTMDGVIYARGQYSCAGRLYSIHWSKITQRCYDNARAAAYGLVECPANVVYQSGGMQGRGLYEFHYNTYFCYG